MAKNTKVEVVELPDTNLPAIHSNTTDMTVIDAYHTEVMGLDIVDEGGLIVKFDHNNGFFTIPDLPDLGMIPSIDGTIMLGEFTRKRWVDGTLACSSQDGREGIESATDRHILCKGNQEAGVAPCPFYVDRSCKPNVRFGFVGLVQNQPVLMEHQTGNYLTVSEFRKFLKKLKFSNKHLSDITITLKKSEKGRGFEGKSMYGITFDVKDSNRPVINK